MAAITLGGAGRELARIVPDRYVFSYLRLIMRRRQVSPIDVRGSAEVLDAPQEPGKRRERRATSERAEAGPRAMLA